MRTLICGSLAFDSIMVFQDHFKHHILPDKIHMLNVSFLVPEMRREYGGCAGNIAYNLKLLGGEPLIMATVGDDFAAYAERLDALAIPRDYIHHVAGTYTAQAFITTDLDDNQITAFHPGAMNYSHENDVRQVPDLKLGIVAPDGRDGMLRHVRGFHEAGCHASSIRARVCRCFPARNCWSASTNPATSSSMITKPSCCRAAPGKIWPLLHAMSRR